MRRRPPLLLTLLPLVIGLAAYFWWWSAQRRAFEAELASVLPARTVIAAGGFPYRLQADLQPARIERSAGGGTLRADAAALEIDRQPWNRQLSVLGARGVGVSAEGGGGVRATLGAATMRASLSTRGVALNRLSSEFTAARLAISPVPVTLSADVMELHLRPLVARAGRRSAQAEVVLASSALRLDGGPGLAVEATARVLADAPLASIARWRSGGAIDARTWIADAHGEVGTIAATLTPVAAGLRWTGVVETVCPASVVAAFARAAPPVEYRARVPVRLRFAGPPGGVVIDAAPPPRGPGAERRREPPCPGLRG